MYCCCCVHPDPPLPNNVKYNHCSLCMHFFHRWLRGPWEPTALWALNKTLPSENYVVWYMQHPRSNLWKRYLNSYSLEGKGFLNPWRKRICKGISASCSWWHIWALQAKLPRPVTWAKPRQQPCLRGHQTCVYNSNLWGCLRCLLVSPCIHICAVGVHVWEQRRAMQVMQLSPCLALHMAHPAANLGECDSNGP